MTTISALRPRPLSPERRRQRRVSTTLTTIAWLAGSIFIFPIAWMIFTSFHSEYDAVGNPPKIFAPLTLSNYVSFFKISAVNNPWPPLINSAMASVISTLLVLAVAIPAAYALSIRRIRKWRDVMIFFLSTRMAPSVTGLLPIYLIARNLHLLDNVWLLVLLYASMNLPVAIWMLRSFLSEVPVEVLEAASVDGASLLLIFRRIIMPLIAPGVAAAALICFIFSWQELLMAQSLTGVRASTAPVFVANFVKGQGSYLASLSAACVMISIPVLAAGIAAQDRLVQGLSLGAVK